MPERPVCPKNMKKHKGTDDERNEEEEEQGIRKEGQKAEEGQDVLLT